MIALWCKKVFYSYITHRITVFGGLGAWGGIGLDLHAPNKIKIVRLAQVARQAQKPDRAGKPNKKRTVWCVLKRVAFVGIPRRVQSPKFPIVVGQLIWSACITLSLTVFYVILLNQFLYELSY